MYVKRDGNGAIVKVSKARDDECQEALEIGDGELKAFLGVTQESDRLVDSDLDFVRVLEDVIHLLMDKGVIRFTDLPDAARDKLVTRQSLRRRINDVGLMGSEDDVI